MRFDMEARVKHATDAVLIAAGILLGLGLVGFVDGILLHQILQWHHMLSSLACPHCLRLRAKYGVGRFV